MPGGVRALAAYLLGMRSVSGVSQRQQTDHLGLVLAPRPHTTLRCLTRTTPRPYLLQTHPRRASSCRIRAQPSIECCNPAERGLLPQPFAGPRDWHGGSTWGGHLGTALDT